MDRRSLGLTIRSKGFAPHDADNGAETEQLIINAFTYVDIKKAPPVMFYQARALMILCAARDSNPEPAD